MGFIQVAYSVTVPVLLLLLLLRGMKPVNHFSRNAIAVSNLLLIGHAVFLIRQLIGFYYLAKQFGELPTKMDQEIDLASIRLLLLMVLPFLSFIGPLRRNIFFSLLLLVLLYQNHPIHTWNTFDLFSKIPFYFSLFCTGYALLWLLKKLPYQSL
jgi:hypothetical protein